MTGETAIKAVLSPFPPLDRGYNWAELLAAFNDSAKLEHPWNFYRATFSSNNNLPTDERENSFDRQFSRIEQHHPITFRLPSKYRGEEERIRNSFSRGRGIFGKKGKEGWNWRVRSCIRCKRGGTLKLPDGKKWQRFHPSRSLPRGRSLPETILHGRKNGGFLSRSLDPVQLTKKSRSPPAGYEFILDSKTGWTS